MSSVKYQSVYDMMTERQKQIMAALYMRGINHSGHSWNTYGDIEDAVADLLELTKMLYEKEEVTTNDTLS